MGADCSIPFSLSSHPSMSSVVYEARVRCCAMCAVNGREEQLWSGYSSPALCRWEKVEPAAETAVAEGQDGTGKTEGDGKSGWTIGVLLFAVVTLFTIVVALILGQVAV